MNTKTLTGRIHQGGFTVVELMVVIVVIGILAGITIVAYSAWRDDTARTVLESDLRSASVAMGQSLDKNGIYPVTLASDTFTSSQGVTFSIVYADKKSFCMQASNEGGTVYVTETQKTPTSGACVSGSLAPPVIISIGMTCFNDSMYAIAPASWPILRMQLEPQSRVSTYRFFNNGVAFSTPSRANPNTTSGMIEYQFPEGQLALGLNSGVNDISITVRAVSPQGQVSADSKPWTTQFNAPPEICN